MSQLLAPFIALFAEYPAFFILVFVLLLIKRFRVAGVILLTLFVICGYHDWIVILVFGLLIWDHCTRE